MEKNIPLERLIKNNDRLGDLLLQENLINDNQLSVAINTHSRKASNSRSSLINTLVQLGYIEKEELNKFMEEYYLREGVFGEFLAKKSIISTEQLAKAYEVHKKSGNTLGKDLISLGYIAEGLFYSLLRKEIQPYELANLLISKKIIAKEQLQRAESVSRWGYRLGEVMVNEGFITDKELKKVLSLQYNIPFKRFNNYKIIEDNKRVLTTAISEKFSRHYKVVPYFINGERIDVALSDVIFLEEIKKHEKTSRYKFHVCMALDKDLKLLQQDLYANIRPQADQILKNSSNSANTENKKLSNEKFVGEYPSEFFRSYALFTQSYFDALKNAGFSEELAAKIVGEQTGVKNPGKIPGQKRTKQITEYFSVIISNSQSEENSITLLFQNYIKSKTYCGENSNGINKEDFKEVIIQHAGKIRKLKRCDSIKCSIIIKNGATKILLIEN